MGDNDGRARRVAVVTGGATGIGLATVSRLAAAGWRVAFFNHRAAEVAAAERHIGSRFPATEFLGATVDLRDEAGVRSFFATAADHWGPVGALVSNAGFVPPRRPTGRTPLAEIPVGEWNDVLRVNLTGGFLACQCVLPGMVAERFGRIVFIGSVGARAISEIAGASYGASKAALTALARSIVSEYSEHGITANTICPGRIVTGMTGPADSAGNLAAARLIRVRRLGEPDEIARVAEFLVSPDSGFISGAVIDVNGGEFSPP